MNEYQLKLKSKMSQLAHLVYKITRAFPSDERYGLISQMRRASVSIVLNYVEGYARRKPLVRLNFLETSLGSLKETEYLLEFSKDELYLNNDDFKSSIELSKEIGAMLWTEINHLDRAHK